MRYVSRTFESSTTARDMEKLWQTSDLGDINLGYRCRCFGCWARHSDNFVGKPRGIRHLVDRTPTVQLDPFNLWTRTSAISAICSNSFADLDATRDLMTQWRCTDSGRSPWELQHRYKLYINYCKPIASFKFFSLTRISAELHISIKQVAKNESFQSRCFVSKATSTLL